MATKRTLSTITFGMTGGPVEVAAPYADAALQSFLNGGEFIKVYDGTDTRYLSKRCMCDVVLGDYTEETVPGVPCEAVDCIDDYPGTTP